jgi:hypothetical protein
LIVFLQDFDQYFPELEKAINECDFCAIDGEFTGVIPYKELNSFDTPKNRYEKMKKVTKISQKRQKQNLNYIYQFRIVNPIFSFNLVCVYLKNKKMVQVTNH